MIDSLYFAALLGVALIASLLSIRLGVSVAILEILLGIVVGNYFGATSSGHEWFLFLAGLGSVVLTFLAGAEIDPEAMKRTWKASLSIGVLSFLAPFLAAWWFTYLALGWTWDASLIAGVALSTTSVAVVYVVLVETGTSKTETGKLILSACFVTDLGTAFALSTLFIRPNYLIIPLAIAMAVVVLITPRLLGWLFNAVRGRPGEPEVKILLLLVVGLGAFAEVASMEAVLPAYILGLVAATVLANHRDALLKMRTLTLAFLTPFFFLNAGMNVSVAAVVTGAALVAVLFAVKVGAKFVGVIPPTLRYVRKDSTYITLLMSTGLTFGTISSQFGLSAGIIDRAQFSILITVVILTAIVPTLIAQRWFRPEGRTDES